MKSQKNNHDVVILGAGMAGLSAGVVFKAAHKDHAIIEKDSAPGGLNRNTTVHGCDFDLGPKILFLDETPDKEELLKYLKGNYQRYPVRESVYLKSFGILDFPLQRNLIDLPVIERQKALRDLEIARKNPRPVKSYYDWLVNSFGEFFCRLVIFPYEEKKWKTPITKMDYKWTLTKPVGVNYDEVIAGSLEKLPPKRFYYYPKTGNISVLTKAIAKKVGKVFLNHKVLKIVPAEHYVETDHGIFHYQKLISTLPLDYITSITTELPSSLKSVSKRYFHRLSIMVINLVFEGVSNLSNTVIYFPEKSVLFRRLSILKNLCPALHKEGFTTISAEMSLQPNEIADPEKLLKKVIADMKKIPELKNLGPLVNWGPLHIDFAYPQQLNGLRSKVQFVHDHYKKFEIYHCGRGGNFDYCDSHQAYRQGKELATKILQD